MKTDVMEVKKKSVSLGWRFSILTIMVILIQAGIGELLQVQFPEFMEENGSNLSFLLIILSVDVIGFPTIYLLTRKMPSMLHEKTKLSPKEFIMYLFMCAGLIGIGTIIGDIIHFALMLPFGVDMSELNAIANLMLEANPIIRVLTVGILAPIFEELIFRKTLIDHIAPTSKFAAILLSGLAFGCFHGNFAQFFYATFLGLIFGYIYLKTGNILYTISYHMIINLSSALITIPLTKNLSKVSQTIDMSLPQEELAAETLKILPATMLFYGWLGFELVMAIIGVVCLIKNRKNFILGNDSEENKEQIAKKTLWNWGIILFYLACSIIFAMSYVPNIVNFITECM